jgi:flagellar biosynthesis protein FlhB
MNPKIDELFHAIRLLEENLLKEIDQEEQKLTRDLLLAQKKFKVNLLVYITRAPLLHLLTAPIIYAGIIPAFILEFFLFIFQMVNFRVYKIAPVIRKDYFAFDRAGLEFLNIVEKINCFYCSYFSGLLAYTTEIVARTEQFWCPIRHARKLRFHHAHYFKFTPYGDGERYRKELPKLRDDLKEK